MMTALDAAKVELARYSTAEEGTQCWLTKREAGVLLVHIETLERLLRQAESFGGICESSPL